MGWQSEGTLCWKLEVSVCGSCAGIQSCMYPEGLGKSQKASETLSFIPVQAAILDLISERGTKHSNLSPQEAQREI